MKKVTQHVELSVESCFDQAATMDSSPHHKTRYQKDTILEGVCNQKTLQMYEAVPHPLVTETSILLVSATIDAQKMHKGELLYRKNQLTFNH
jgi:hypothetical protein